MFSATSNTESSGQKLDYQEITPCLKQVTKVWQEMLNTPSRKTYKFDRHAIERAVKDGIYLLIADCSTFCLGMNYC